MPRGKVSVRGVECRACGKRFTGSRNAMKHAKSEGHYQFRNVDVTRTRVNPETYAKRG